MQRRTRIKKPCKQLGNACGQAGADITIAAAKGKLNMLPCACGQQQVMASQAIAPVMRPFLLTKESLERQEWASDGHTGAVS